MTPDERWQRLLSHRRLGRDRQEPAARARSDFQRDYDRIVFSSAFRRLQDKTQVFPLAESDYVRTRLTHSIEVSCVGRSLGNLVGEVLCERYDLAHLGPSDFGAVVAAASLAHDLGNPPFGHAGEDAIQGWIADSPLARRLIGRLDAQQRADLAAFEGNAQGFRVLTRLQSPDNPGMQLTAAVLAAFMKYPRASDLPRGAGVSSKKYGFFAAEQDFFAEVAATTGLAERVPRRAWQRHPLAFLVEAADDICYHIIDLEDGYRLGHVPYEEAYGRLIALLERAPVERRLAAIGEDKRRIEYLRAVAIGALTQAAARAFIEHETAILDGRFDRELLGATALAEPLAAIKSYSVERVYKARPVLEIEVAGFEVLGGLLELLAAAVEQAAQGRAGARSRVLLDLLPDQFLGPGRRPDPDPYRRLLQVTDYVAGMTDTYAVALFKKVRGISLPTG